MKKPDYLKEIINKRKMGNRSNSSKGRDNYEDGFVGINKQSTKWEKAMNKNDGNMLEKINDVQNKVEIIEKEAEEKEKLLKLRGGIENNPIKLFVSLKFPSFLSSILFLFSIPFSGNFLIKSKHNFISFL